MTFKTLTLKLKYGWYLSQWFNCLFKTLLFKIIFTIYTTGIMSKCGDI